MSTPGRLVLFDVDGTLLLTGGLAGAALGRAMAGTFGRELSIEGYSFAGKTDPRIVRELGALAGLPADVVERGLDEVFRAYLAELATALGPGTVRVLPGVVEVLDALASRPEVVVGLLTGNIAPGAEIKLRAAGLADRFQLGAFGSDDADRDRLVAVARSRALALCGDGFPGLRTVVVGDAEADIRCARAGGARAVAVCTGWTAREELAALAPDALLDSLASPVTLSALLDGESG